MSIEKDKMKWECAYNHLPQWVEDLDASLSACMSKKDIDRELWLLERYNQLTEKEESNNEDGHSLYGVEDEKQDILNEIIKINEKYKDEAIELEKMLKESNIE